MQFTIPDDILARAEASETDVRISLAVQLYTDNRIDHRDACRLAGLSVAGMNGELLRRGITIQQCPHRSFHRPTAGSHSP